MKDRINRFLDEYMAVVIIGMILIFWLIIAIPLIIYSPTQADIMKQTLPAGTTIVKEIDKRYLIVNIEGVEYLAQDNGLTGTPQWSFYKR